MTANPRKTLDQAATKSPLQSTDMLPLLRLGGSALQRYGPDDITAYALASGGFAKPDGSNVPYRQGVANLREFGAFLNGVDDDLPAFTAAVASLPASGGTVEWTGFARFNSGYVAPAGRSNVRLAPGGGSALYNPAHGFTFLTLPNTVALWQIRSLAFVTDNGASGAGESWLIDDASDNLVTTDIYALNVWSGLRLKGTKTFIQGRTYVQSAKPSAGRVCVIDMGTNEVCEVDNLVAINAGGQDCLAGYEINSGSAVAIGGSLSKCGTPAKLNPGGGQVIATLEFLSLKCDTSASHGVWLTGSGAIQRLTGSVTASGNALDGVKIDNPANSAQLSLRLQANVGNGMTLADVSHNESIFNVAAYGNGSYGVDAVAGASNFTVNGVAGAGDNFSGNGIYGVAIGAGCDHFTVNISGTGNGTALLFNAAGTGTSKSVATRI